MQSLVLSLSEPVRVAFLERALSNSGIAFDGKETANPVSFPGWSSFGDILCSKEDRMLVGLAFHVPTQYREHAKKMASVLSPAVAGYRTAESNEGVYGKYPGSAWLEIVWSRVRADTLVKAQTNDVVWYFPKRAAPHAPPLAIGVEHLAFLADEAEMELAVPQQGEFPMLRFTLLND